MKGAVQRQWPWWLLLALVLAGASWMLVLRGKDVEIVRVTRGPLLQSIVATGRIATPAHVEISSQQAARIDAIDVREGDRVQAGQALVRLRSDEAEAAIAAAEAALREAQGRLELLSQVQRPVNAEQVAQAGANLANAEREFQRTRELVSQGFVSQSRADEARRTVDAARAAHAAAQAQAGGTRKDGAEVALARTRIEQSRANLESARARRDTLVLRAPADAVVLTRSADPGDTAQAGRAILTLAQAGATRIIATVDERNLRWLRLGQTAAALADAFPDQPFTATLSHIAPAVDAQRATVEVWFRVDDPPQFLRPDMTVSVETTVGRVDDALRLPSWALRGADSTFSASHSTVLVIRDGRAEFAEVELGMRGVGTVQIVSGLQEGDEVIAPSAGARPGQRVRGRASSANAAGTGPQAGRAP